MKIVQIVTLDGTCFRVGDVKFGGTIKSIEDDVTSSDVASIHFLLYVSGSHKVIRIPYHSVLYYIEE